MRVYYTEMVRHTAEAGHTVVADVVVSDAAFHDIDYFLHNFVYVPNPLPLMKWAEVK